MPRAARPPLAAALMLLAAVPPASGQVRPTTDARAAIAASAATGRPILAVAGHTGCVYCRQIKTELTSPTPAAKLAERFVVLLMDTDLTPSWPLWERRFAMEGDGVPKVWAVRADGEVLYAKSGKPRDLVDFLERRLKDSGKIYVGDDLKRLLTDVKGLKRLARRDRASYVKLVVEYAAEETYAAPAVQIAAAADGLASEADEELIAAAETLADAEADAADRFDAAAALLELAAVFTPMPETHRRITDRIAAFEDAEETGDPAGFLVRARLWRAAEAAGDARDWAAAVATRDRLIAEHPGTEAARRAGDGLDGLRRRAAAAAARDAAAAARALSGAQE